MCVRVLAQKSEEATASSASLLATPLEHILFEQVRRFLGAILHLGPGPNCPCCPPPPVSGTDCTTTLYHASNWLYLILLNCNTLYHRSTLLYLTLLHSTTALLSSTRLYLTLPHSTMAVLGSTSLYLTVLHSTMPPYTWVYT